MKFEVFIAEIESLCPINKRIFNAIDEVDLLEVAYNRTEAKYIKEKKLRMIKKGERGAKKWA